MPDARREAGGYCAPARATLEITMVFVLDNYDSFTYNLVQYLGELGAEVVVRRNDEVTPEEVEAMKPERILLSPGPARRTRPGFWCRSSGTWQARRRSSESASVTRQSARPLAARWFARKTLMHGKTSAVEHDGKGIFAGLPTPLTCTRYHSLIVEEESLPAELDVTAQHARKPNRSRHSYYGPAPSQFARRRRAVPPRERAHRGRAPDDPQLSGHVAYARSEECQPR